MGPKAYAIKSSGNATKESSWMDRMCQKIETYCDFEAPGRGPSLFIQEIEVQFNTFGAGLRKFANEANEFVQELLSVPTLTPTEGNGEKVVDLPKQRDMKVVQGEQQVAKQSVKQPASTPMNFFDEACMKMTKKGEAKEGRDSDFTIQDSDFKVLAVKDADKFPFGDVAWDWPQQPFNQLIDVPTVQERFEMGQASCASVEPPDSEVLSFLKETEEVGETVKGSNEMVEGEDQSTVTWSPTDDKREPQIDATFDSSVLDGWEGDDIVINEDEEPDTWQDWELV